MCLISFYHKIGQAIKMQRLGKKYIYSQVNNFPFLLSRLGSMSGLIFSKPLPTVSVFLYLNYLFSNILKIISFLQPQFDGILKMMIIYLIPDHSCSFSSLWIPITSCQTFLLYCWLKDIIFLICDRLFRECSVELLLDSEYIYGNTKQPRE